MDPGALARDHVPAAEGDQSATVRGPGGREPVERDQRGREAEAGAATCGPVDAARARLRSGWWTRSEAQSTRSSSSRRQPPTGRRCPAGQASAARATGPGDARGDDRHREEGEAPGSGPGSALRTRRGAGCCGAGLLVDDTDMAAASIHSDLLARLGGSGDPGTPTTVGSPYSQARIAPWESSPPRSTTSPEMRGKRGAHPGSVCRVTRMSPGDTAPASEVGEDHGTSVITPAHAPAPSGRRSLRPPPRCRSTPRPRGARRRSAGGRRPAGCVPPGARRRCEPRSPAGGRTPRQARRAPRGEVDRVVRVLSSPPGPSRRPARGRRPAVGGRGAPASRGLVRAW